MRLNMQRPDRLNIEDIDIAETQPDEQILLIDEALNACAPTTGMGAHRHAEILRWPDGQGSRRDAASHRPHRAQQMRFARAWLLEDIREQARHDDRRFRFCRDDA